MTATADAAAATQIVHRDPVTVGAGRAVHIREFVLNEAGEFLRGAVILCGEPRPSGPRRREYIYPRGTQITCKSCLKKDAARA